MVKCQNLKTQEVVAVKVIKNRTAYFNQSMMEVSVLDLVRLSLRIPPVLFLQLCSCLGSSLRYVAHECTADTDRNSSIRSLTRTTTTTCCDSRTPSSIGNICAWCSSC